MNGFYPDHNIDIAWTNQVRPYETQGIFSDPSLKFLQKISHPLKFAPNGYPVDYLYPKISGR